jgi:hypothetical protein
MGRAPAILLHRELASVVDENLERIGPLLEEREGLIAAGEDALVEKERQVATREKAALGCTKEAEASRIPSMGLLH